jgi:PIN domain nuclease of toxin-antitoxin system
MALSASTRDALLAALCRTRIAKEAAKEVGVHPVTAWRFAKKHRIKLIPLASHMKKRRSSASFRAKQIAPQRRAASAWLKAQHAKPQFHQKTVEAARRTLTALNRDPAFRKASSDRLKSRYKDPAFRRLQAEASREGIKAFHRRRRLPPN